MLHDRPGGGDFASTLDEAIRERGLTVAEVRRRLDALGTPISDSAIRFWRTGQRRPEHGRSFDVLVNLEDVLQLDRGELSTRLGPSRRLRRSPTEPFDELVGEPGALRPLLETIGCADLAELESVGGTLVVDIGADRRVRATSNRMVWRARVDGATRMRVVLGLDAPTEVAPTIEVVGAEVGRSAYDPVAGLSAWELVLPRPLAVGETAMIEWSCADAVEDDVPTQYECVAERKVDEAALWVRFDADVPRWIERFEDDDHGWRPHVLPSTGQAVHHSVRDFGPGVFGFHWRW